jgi:hypothetical protein
MFVTGTSQLHDVFNGRSEQGTNNGLSFGSQPSRPRLQYGQVTKSSLSGVGQ